MKIKYDPERDLLSALCSQLFAFSSLVSLSKLCNVGCPQKSFVTIGEALKQIDKITEDALLPHYPSVDWKKAKGMRDFISHHYFDIDHEVVFTVCQEHIPTMTGVIRSILKDLEKENREG